MTTMVRTAGRSHRRPAPADSAERTPRDPVSGPAPTETFFRAGRIATAADSSSPLERAVSAVVIWVALYGMLVALTLAFSGPVGG